MHREATALFQRLGVHIDPRRPALGLSIADQQIIEIAKAISLDARLLIMDEPTAALSGNEVARLFAVARSLRDEGRALVFISHRFDEVFALCDHVTVMRDGSYISTDSVAETTESQIVAKMVGREVGDLFPKTPAEIGEVVLDVQGLETAGEFHDVSFQVRAGEIVGLAGLVGAGRSEIARAVFGVDAYDAGSVTLAGKPVPAHDPRSAIRAGIAFVPEDRRQQGLVIEGSVGKNIASVIRSRHRARPASSPPGSEYGAARPWADRLEVKTNALDMKAATMSGGNQQKVVIAKWLATNPKLLIIDEPTRGIDVGTKAEVHRLLSELAGQGLAILMISSELPEVLGMADRVLVVCEGRITADIARDDATPENVMAAATRSSREGRVMSTDLLVEPSRQSRGQRALGTPAALPRAVHRDRARRSSWSPRRPEAAQFVFSHDGWRDTLLTPSILLLLAVGQMVVIVTRNVDLSVGSVLGITAYATGKIFIANPDIPVRAGVPGRAADRCGARRGQRLPRRLLPGAGPRRHARHDVCLPRLPHQPGGQQAHRGR